MKKKQEKKTKKFVLKTGRLAPNKYTSFGTLTFIVIGAIVYCILIFPYWAEFVALPIYAAGH